MNGITQGAHQQHGNASKSIVGSGVEDQAVFLWEKCFYE